MVQQQSILPKSLTFGVTDPVFSGVYALLTILRPPVSGTHMTLANGFQGRTLINQEM